MRAGRRRWRGLAGAALGALAVLAVAAKLYAETVDDSIRATDRMAVGTNSVATGPTSFAGGEGSRATNKNSFVWSDGTTTGSAGSNRFVVSASGGVLLQGANIVLGYDITPTETNAVHGRKFIATVGFSGNGTGLWLWPQGDLGMGSFTNNPPE